MHYKNEFINPTLIGGGENWEVYRCEPINRISETIIMRIPKLDFGNSNNSFHDNYKRIKNLGLPTLKFLEIDQYRGKNVIITEDLNRQGNIIFVSPNSVVPKMPALLRKLSSDMGFNQESRKHSIAEVYRYKNKIDEIIDIEKFLKEVQDDLIRASKLKLIIDFDCYFFGTSRNKNKTTIKYLLADLDNIREAADENSYLIKQNISEFRKAFNSFLEYFVKDNENRRKYFEAVKEM